MRDKKSAACREDTVWRIKSILTSSNKEWRRGTSGEKSMLIFDPISTEPASQGPTLSGSILGVLASLMLALVESISTKLTSLELISLELTLVVLTSVELILVALTLVALISAALTLEVPFSEVPFSNAPH